MTVSFVEKTWQVGGEQWTSQTRDAGLALLDHQTFLLTPMSFFEEERRRTIHLR
jgi:hypothetical protein